jgi:hypothetical protein
MKHIFLYFFLVIWIYSCKAPATIIQKKEIKNISPAILYDSLRLNYGNIHSYYGKFKAIVTQDKKSNTVYGTVKIKRDSLLWISLNPGMGIEIARAQMRPDSLFLLDRLNARYLKGKYDYIDKMFDIEVDFASLQSIFLNTLSFYTAITDTQNVLKNIIIKKEKNGKYIQIENFRKRIIKRNDGDVMLPPVYERIMVNNRNLKISEVIVKDFKDDKQMKIEYSDFVYTDSLKADFPQTITIKVDRGLKSISMSIMFSKQEFNFGNSYQFYIPESYKPFDFKQ